MEIEFFGANYCLESVNLLSHYYCLLPPRYAKQLKWSKFINMQGTNISADLHVEHLYVRKPSNIWEQTNLPWQSREFEMYLELSLKPFIILMK